MKRILTLISITFFLAAALLSCEKNTAKKQMKNIATVKTMLKLLEQEKIKDMINLFAENGKQVNPYNSGLFPGEIKGKAALLKFWKPVPGRFDGMKFPIKKIYPMKDPNVVLAVFTGKIKLKGGKGYYNNDYYCIFKFNNQGKIVEYVEIFNPVKVIKAFNLKDKI